MKPTYLLLLLIPCFFGSCLKENVTKDMGGMTIWWKHTVHEKEERGLLFYLTGYNRINKNAELVFDYSIEGSELVIELTDVIEKKRITPLFSDNLQSGSPQGELFIPDRLLEAGIYTVRLITPHFEEQLELSKDAEKYTLKTPVSNNIHCDVEEAYFMPYNLLHIQLIHRGSPLATQPQDLIDELNQVGFTPIAISSAQQLALQVNKDGSPSKVNSNNGIHKLELFLNLNNNFEQAEAIVTNHLSQATLPSYRVNLYGSNGEKAILFN